MPITFEWDPLKATANLEKHGISFEEAQGAFQDPLSITIADPEHSEHEARFATIGMTAVGKYLVVVHTDRGEAIRIISAWEASSAERRQYEREPRS